MAKLLKIKAQDDDQSYTTYWDQNFIEIYNLYDLREEEPVPQAILDAEVIEYDERADKKKVQLDYKLDDVFTLNSGSLGHSVYYSTMGRKALLRGGNYKHPHGHEGYRIEYMTPESYIKRCYDMFKAKGRINIDLDTFIARREDDYDLDEVFGPAKGNIFAPAIEYKQGGQEGLHRAIWAMRNGIAKLPVIIKY